ncbi:HNH endonuclease signature motif containing protein [Mycobacterium sp. OTB74]|uniref:HNH endonuclease signature motif containing protein n=1 Tax=Mycobacterium sp. OTB74 TaxID=1853452 RepID=UPI00247596AA|nr:HNH endonuclease signature motif containing protein [Mycobacterium sp. OTB74]MDH6243079.1 hypothetical protein [Mycobacterium sp. OTB74]
MFDTVESLGGVDDSALIDAIITGERAEAMAASTRLTAMGELVARRCGNQGERERWACDGWDAAAAEIGAALNIGRRAASRDMHIAMALRERHPKIAALLAAGDIPIGLVETICWHTTLVSEPDTMALIDTALAGALNGWGRLSGPKLMGLIDGWVEKFDPAAVRRTRNRARARTVELGKPEDRSGVASIWGALLATDAALLDARLSAMASQVCHDDPRTVGQRRSDALGTLAAGSLQLACLCGTTDCPATIDDARAAAVTVHVLAQTVPAPADSPADPMINGPHHQALTPEPQPPATTEQAAVGYVLGGMLMPAILFADLISRGAKVHTVTSIESLTGKSGYRPTARLDEFVRMRDMTCMFPGCDHPAVTCDIDHTIPWPSGPTHPANLSPKCRKHHLLKTFWTGPGGWRDRQLPDGSIVWTAPTGHSYISVPGSRILFPDHAITTPLPTTDTRDLDIPDAPGRGLMMPTRRKTRTQDHARRIAYERTLNEQELADAGSEPEKPSTPRQPAPAIDDPPPF